MLNPTIPGNGYKKQHSIPWGIAPIVPRSENNEWLVSIGSYYSPKMIRMAIIAIVTTTTTTTTTTAPTTPTTATTATATATATTIKAIVRRINPAQL